MTSIGSSNDSSADVCLALSPVISEVPAAPVAARPLAAWPRMWRNTSRTSSRCRTRSFGASGPRWQLATCRFSTGLGYVHSFQVAQLREENSELQKLTTDEDKTLLLWKAGRSCSK